MLKIVLLTLFPFVVFAKIFHVGINESYSSPNALYLANVIDDHDTIMLAAETFSGTDATAVWMKDDLHIVGVFNETYLDADGAYIWGKGIWVCAGNNITIENISFNGAKVPDLNGAGIRLDGSGLTVRYCHFTYNEMGILSNNEPGTIKVEFCEFGNNGYGDGFSHNIYVNHADSLIFQYNYSHHSVIGHTLKSRANYNFIAYNRFDDGVDGQSSRLIDIPNGGTCILLANELIQGPLAENKNMIGYGLESLSNSMPHELYLINNTIISRRSSALFLDIEAGTEFVKVINNVFAGIGDLNSGNIDELTINVIAEDESILGFEDVLQDNFALLENSSLVNAGISPGTTNGGVDLQPIYEYLHQANVSERISDDWLDIGAHEFEMLIRVRPELDVNTQIFPNPVNELIHIDSKESLVRKNYLIYSSLGRIIQNGQLSGQTIDVNCLHTGNYTLKIENRYFQFVKL